MGISIKKQANYSWFWLLAMLSAVVLALSFAIPASAQDEEAEEPEAAPTEEVQEQITRQDPLWAQFTAARRAIEAERDGVDLTFVRSYRYAQQEYERGIDWICVEDVAESDVRPVYFGFTWTITDLGGTVHQARTSVLPGNEIVVAVCDEVIETGAAAPDTALPAPIEGSGAVGDFELGGHVDGLGANAVSAMRQSGMTWVKKQVRFSVGGGTGTAQSYIDDARNNGFKIMLGIVGWTNEMGDFDNYITQYADFVGQVAALGPDAIEVWNEPNIAREWPEGQISGANYTRLLRAAYTSIKAANPDVMVISGAPAPTGAEAAFPGQVVNDDNFMLQMREAGAGNYFDCIGLHYNEGIVSPTQSTGAQDGYPTRYFGTMLARGANVFPERPVCWTELGYLSGEGMGQPIPPAFAWASDVTLAQHATWLAEAARLSAQSDRVRLMIVWNVNFTRWDDDPMGGYAMLRPDGTCPACSTLGTVMGVSGD
ncbi:MAG: hypothetical protein EA396_14960 [Anaerolineaceae bacterium]|nr:MAG: hypothetical protein EA396_14960 [Anaerolineaceae bacterium]